MGLFKGNGKGWWNDLQDHQSTLLPMWGTSFQGDSVFSLKQSAQRKLKISFSDETCQIDQLTKVSDNRSVQGFVDGYCTNKANCKSQIRWTFLASPALKFA